MQKHTLKKMNPEKKKGAMCKFSRKTNSEICAIIKKDG